MVRSVYLREKEMRSGRTFLYLQYYPAIRDPRTMRKIKWEPLHLQVHKNPRTKQERDLNRVNREIANDILLRRKYQIASEEYGIVNPYAKSEDALRYFKSLAVRKPNTKWMATYNYFEKYMHGECVFGEIDENLCEGFMEFLLITTDTKNGMKLHQNTASAYYGLFKAMLKKAYKERWIRDNIADKLDGIKTLRTHKEFLTLDELKSLASTECESDVLKRASLFSCFTGLRISDIMQLKWENIIRNQFGGYSLQLNTVKNGKLAENPLSDEALEFCGQRGVGQIFKGLTRQMIYETLPEWIRDAGIAKHITFHCFRHTYATLQVAAGTDIYTVSKMLTHSNVSTTQIYADMVSEKKLETTLRISLKDDVKADAGKKRRPGRPRKNRQ